MTESSAIEPESDDDAKPEAPSGRIQSGKLAGKSLFQALLIVSVPVLFQQTMAAFVGLADKMFAGGLPDDVVLASLDGMGVGSYVGWLIGIAMSGLGIGGQAIIARAMGAGDTSLAAKALGQTLVMGFFWSILVAAAMWVLAPPLAQWCDLSPGASVACIEYVRVLAIALPATSFMMVGAMGLVGAGETLWPAIIAVVVNIVNVIVSWLLSGATISIAGQGYTSPLGLDWHVEGIAAGTAAGWVVGGVMTVWVVLRGIKDLRVRMHHLRPDRSVSWRVVRIGIPNFLEGMSMWAANLVVLGILGIVAGMAQVSGALWTLDGMLPLGNAGEGLVGAHVIAIQWESFSFLPGFAIGTAAAALAGQYLGAGNEAMARRAVKVCTVLAVCVMGVLGLVFIFAGQALTALVSDKAVYLALTPDLLKVCGVMQIFFAMSMVVRQALRGLGDTTWVFWITTFSSYGIRLPLAWVLGVTFEWGLVGIWIGLCGEMVVRAMFFLARFRWGSWAQKQL